MMEKPELDPLPTWFQRAWLQLRSALFIGTVAAAFVMGALKAWREAFPPATKEDVEAVRDDVKQMSDEQLRNAIDSTTRLVVEDAIGHLRAENDSVFNAMVRDVVEPGIKRQNQLMAEVKRLNKMLGVSNSLLEEQDRRTAVTGDKLDELRIMMQRGNSNEELMQMLRAIQNDNEQIKRKLKIQTQRF